MPAVDRIVRILREKASYWMPHVKDKTATKSDLSVFYRNRLDYHKMTAGGDKLSHPQVQLFLSHLKPHDICLEFGCGGGVVLSGVVRLAQKVIGLDYSRIGLKGAKEKNVSHNKAVLVESDIAHAPIAHSAVDVVYSFEVLEHVWNPAVVLDEMVRVLKPGGLLFFSTPNGFSLDLHLERRPILRAIDYMGALRICAISWLTKKVFWNMEPDLKCAQVYPDCDMITKIFAGSLERYLKSKGMEVEKCDTFFFQREKCSSIKDKEKFVRYEMHPFIRHFGDHILVVARKINKTL
ncbi:MAG: class I SAM-dependent methyltransferase [Verrucomicrobiota bacterium]|nr:class I SAM-dependent methyltransferase [Verrucomicrobiota bacterium]